MMEYALSINQQMKMCYFKPMVEHELNRCRDRIERDRQKIEPVVRRYRVGLALIAGIHILCVSNTYSR